MESIFKRYYIVISGRVMVLHDENKLLRSNIKDSEMWKRLDTIWSMAERELHPFQKGVSAQDTNHCLRVEGHIWSLIFKNNNKFSNTDLFLLSAAASLHDVGKIADGSSKGNKDHGEIAADWLLAEGNWRKCHIESKVEAEAIAHIIRVHSNGEINEVPEIFVIGNPPGVFLRSLAALFRLADMLDSDFRRCPDLAKSLKQLKFPKEIETWISRSTIEGWDVSTDGKKILLIASPENEEKRVAALACVDILNKDLTESQRDNLANYRAGYWVENQHIEAILHFPTQFSLAEHEGSALVEKGGLVKFYDQFMLEYTKRLATVFRDVSLRGIGDFREGTSISLSKIFIDVDVTLESGWAPKTYQGYKESTIKWIKDSLFVNRLPITEVFTTGKLRRLVLLGEPGSGKSTISQFLLLNELSAGSMYLPFLVMVRDFVSKKGAEGNLLTYITNQTRSIIGGPIPPGFVEFLLANEKTLVIFDGLDEVSSPLEREQTRDLIMQFVTCFPDPNFLITSRIVGYEEGPFDPDNFLHLLLLGLEKSDVKAFVRRWYFERETNPTDRDAAIKGFLEALKDEHVAELAQNPLLLTIMALVNRGEADLPKQRAMLYNKCVEAFMVSRNRAKDLLTYDENEIRACHEFLGYWMHKRAEQVRGSFSGVYLAELKGALIKDMTKRRPELKLEVKEKVEEFFDAARKRVGLIVERGSSLWAFGHRSFQEYFAARYISQNTCGIEEIWEEVGDKIERSHWIEPMKLLAGIYGFTSRKTLDDLTRRIMQEHSKEDDSKKKLFLAGEIAGEVTLIFPLMQQIATETIELLLDTSDTNIFNNCKRMLDHFCTNSYLWSFIVKKLKERTQAFRISHYAFSGTAFYTFYSSKKLGDTRIDRVLSQLF